MTPNYPLAALYAVALVALVIYLAVKIAKLRRNPRLPLVAEQSVHFPEPGSYALWFTGAIGGVVLLLPAAYADVWIIEAATGRSFEADHPHPLSFIINGVGPYCRFASFVIERAGRYTVRIDGPALRYGSRAQVILERRR